MSESMRPLVSILIPTRDRAALLQETLRSVRSQTYENWEVIVVDDHSTDDTARVLDAAGAADPRIRPLRRAGEVPGAQGCRNQALAASRGEFVLLLDSDDVLAPACLQGRIDALEEDPALDFVVFQAAMFVKSPEDAQWLWNRFSDRSDLERFLDLDAPWGICNVLWRRGALEKLAPLDENLPRYQDWALHTRALLARQIYVKINRVDCYVRDDSAGHARISGGHRGESTRWVRHLVNQVDTGLAGWEQVPDSLQRLQVGFHFWYALRLSSHHRDEALAYWRKFRKHDLITPWIYHSGFAHLLVRRYRVIHRGIHLIRRWTWPPGLFIQFGSGTFHREAMSNAD